MNARAKEGYLLVDMGSMRKVDLQPYSTCPLPKEVGWFDRTVMANIVSRSTHSLSHTHSHRETASVEKYRFRVTHI